LILCQEGFSIHRKRDQIGPVRREIRKLPFKISRFGFQDFKIFQDFFFNSRFQDVVKNLENERLFGTLGLIPLHLLVLIGMKRWHVGDKQVAAQGINN